MKGWFVTSGYFQNESVLYVKEAFQKAFQKEGVEFLHYKSNQLAYWIDQGGDVVFKAEKPDFVIFWDKDIVLASMLEKWGARVFNNSKSIEICDDKVKTLVHLANCGIPMPKTVFAPLVFSNRQETDDTFLDNLVETLDFPIVVKESNGSFGWQVYLANNVQQLKTLRQKLVHTSHLYQEFVSSSKGRDVRVIVIGGKAVCSMTRQNDGDFRANVELGGVAKYQPVDDSFLQMAQKCSNELNLDYAGVDLLIGDNGQPLLCEVNSNAYFRGMESCFDIDVAHVYLRHILKNI